MGRGAFLAMREFPLTQKPDQETEWDAQQLCSFLNRHLRRLRPDHTRALGQAAEEVCEERQSGVRQSNRVPPRAAKEEGRVYAFTGLEAVPEPTARLTSYAGVFGTHQDCW
jgi:hypothetical protein